MSAPRHLPLVEVTRGRIVESVHYGSLCAARPDGSILFSLGDTETKFFLRSSAKPFQALAFLERGGAEHYHLEPREIALICASHSGTEAHIQVLEALQRKVGIDESNLLCGAHLPYSQKSADELMKQGITPRPNHNNCSGKHTAMLAFAKMIGAPLEDYLEPSHPVQKAILNTFAEMCGLDTRGNRTRDRRLYCACLCGAAGESRGGLRAPVPAGWSARSPRRSLPADQRFHARPFGYGCGT